MHYKQQIMQIEAGTWFDVYNNWTKIETDILLVVLGQTPILSLNIERIWTSDRILKILEHVQFWNSMTFGKNEYRTLKHYSFKNWITTNHPGIPKRVEEQFWPIFDPILSYLGYTCFTAWFCEYLFTSDFEAFLHRKLDFFIANKLHQFSVRNFAKDTFLRRNSYQNIFNPSGLLMCSLENLWLTIFHYG